jgi:diguanylate cyclase (GGDEF)-like protein/PAS domain S-box-containing protein
VAARQIAIGETVDTEQSTLLGQAMRDAAIAMLLIAPEGSIIEVNAAACEYFGRDSATLTASTWQELTHPDDLSADLGYVNRLLRGEANSYRMTKRYMHADGTVIVGDLSVRAIRSDDGAVSVFISQIVDVTARARAESELERSQALLRGVLDTMQDPWVLLDPVREPSTGRIVDFVYADANIAACVANGVPREELLGRRLLDLYPEHEPRGLIEAYANVIISGRPLAVDDDPFPDREDPRRILRFDNRAVRIGTQLSLTWRDVTDRYERRQRLTRQAHHDDLTGLPNRARLRERLASVFSRSPRTGQSIALLYCDLDDFKPINDDFGHAAGDEVLRAIGGRIASSVRTQDIVARLGGDEFVAVLEGVHSAADAVAVADKVRLAVSEPITVDQATVSTTMSIGVAIASPGDDPETTLAAADTALYVAKGQGGDRTVLYRPGDESVA